MSEKISVSPMCQSVGSPLAAMIAPFALPSGKVTPCSTMPAE